MFEVAMIEELFPVVRCQHNHRAAEKIQGLQLFKESAQLSVDKRDLLVVPVDDHLTIGLGELRELSEDLFSRFSDLFGCAMIRETSAKVVWRPVREMGIDQIPAEHKEWNGKLEVFNANLSKELFDVHRFYDVAEMKRRLAAHLHWYNHGRTSHALGGLLVPADRYYGRSDEVMARIEAGLGRGEFEGLDLRDRCLELFKGFTGQPPDAAPASAASAPASGDEEVNDAPAGGKKMRGPKIRASDIRSRAAGRAE